VLDIAEELKREGVRPRRSVLFAFFTGEEKGMLGSKYFTAHPTVDVQSIVGDVNLDGVMAFTPLTSVFVEGQDDSSLGDAARRAISSQNVASASDPNNRSIGSSDQYSFIERDIPAVRLLVHFPGESKKVIEAWERDRVHKPADDLSQPVDTRAAAKFEEIIWQLVLDVANDVNRPQWKPSSIYHQRYR
jgi:Zn-dependent M28 family amino/carboxypeptidase